MNSRNIFKMTSNVWQTYVVHILSVFHADLLPMRISVGHVVCPSARARTCVCVCVLSLAPDLDFYFSVANAVVSFNIFFPFWQSLPHTFPLNI